MLKSTGMRVESVPHLQAFLREARKKRKLSVPELSDIIGYTGSAIYYWERGARNVKLVTLLDWAQGLGYEIHIVEREND